MTGLTFVDTNILLYAHDKAAGVKRERSIECLQQLWDARSGALSVQVLQEFYVNATRKLPSPLGVSTAREILGTYSAWVRTVPTVETVLRGSHIAEFSRISFWDGMIVASAEQAGATRLLTEDLNPGQMIAGILIVNPLLR